MRSDHLSYSDRSQGRSGSKVARLSSSSKKHGAKDHHSGAIRSEYWSDQHMQSAAASGISNRQPERLVLGRKATAVLRFVETAAFVSSRHSCPLPRMTGSGRVRLFQLGQISSRDYRRSERRYLWRRRSWSGRRSIYACPRLSSLISEYTARPGLTRHFAKPLPLPSMYEFARHSDPIHGEPG